MTKYYQWHQSPLGELLLAGSGEAITDVHLRAGKYLPEIRPDWLHGPHDAVLNQLRRELDDYFAGRLRRFGVALAAQGTAFQKQAWAFLAAIPFGETRSYRQQACAIGRPNAARAVGAANGRNPIGIVLPCHRVIGADGSMAGYAGGIESKEFLLKLEGVL
ncbi:MAG: methylated-DNA--[protein]-cysteine S-methyltransferase [Sulfuritalea sp.]|nr:methylated-DNA--[protein]-cysteine S-methyltransferase [Sulfuritalea sp.]